MGDINISGPSHEREQDLTNPFDLKQVDKSFFEEFTHFLTEFQFTEKAIIEALKLTDLEFIKETEFPIYDLLLEEDNKLHQLIRFFTLNLPLTNSKANVLFESLYEPLFKVGLLTRSEGLIHASVDLHPCLGLYICTDHRFNCKVDELRVYYLGKDSYALGRGLPDKKVKYALDLCAGSGVHGLLMSRICEKAVCADINPRAISFIQFNAQLNQVENLQICLSNLYEDIPPVKYDLILSNPPFVPDPTFNHYFNSTITGEKILQLIIEGLPQFLSEEGLCQIFTLLIHKKDHYLDRINHWLNQDMNILSYEDLNFRYSIKDYMLLHLSQYLNSDTYHARLQEWYLAAEKEGLGLVADGVLNFKHGPKASTVLHVNLDFNSFENYVNAYFDKVNLNPESLLHLNPLIKGISQEKQSGQICYYVTFSEGLYTTVPVKSEIYPLIMDHFMIANEPIRFSQLETYLKQDARDLIEELIRLNILIIE